METVCTWHGSRPHPFQPCEWQQLSCLLRFGSRAWCQWRPNSDVLPMALLDRQWQQHGPPVATASHPKHLLQQQRSQPCPRVIPQLRYMPTYLRQMQRLVAAMLLQLRCLLQQRDLLHHPAVAPPLRPEMHPRATAVQAQPGIRVKAMNPLLVPLLHPSWWPPDLRPQAGEACSRLAAAVGLPWRRGGRGRVLLLGSHRRAMSARLQRRRAGACAFACRRSS
mmetsp:Transcript_98129/g.306052  ORF Transcript_98129/g.306052 Transcript_98129/m.306052 type:complete len:222 (-) Transcript_98129:247-912(-)